MPASTCSSRTTFDRIPKDVSYSIERAYFPSLIERKEMFVAYVDRGYWIDIGTPEKYVQVHRDMFDGKFAGGMFASADRTKPIVSPEARIEDGVTIDGPCFIDAGAHVKAGATVGAYTVLGRGVDGRGIRRACRTPSCGRTRASARTRSCTGPIIGRNCHIGRNAVLKGRALLGDKTQLTDFTSIGP